MTLQPEPSRSSEQVGPDDPEHNPTASYALEPDYARGLTNRVVSTTGQTVPAYSPISGQPLARIPQSSEGDVREAFVRARHAQQAWARTSLEHRSALLLRLHDLVLERQDEVVQPQQQRRTVLQTGACPRLLRVPGAYEGLTHVALTRLRDPRERLPADG